MTAGDDDFRAVVDNLGKARKSLGRLSRILIREGADLKVSVNFYEAVAQAVLLFGAETWFLTQSMERALDSSQSRVMKRIARKQLRRRTDGIWDYPPLTEALRGAGLKGIRKLVTSRQNMVAQYITTRPIIDLCERATWRTGARVSWWWW